MSAVRRRNAQELLCGALPASMLSYAAVLHIHAVTGLSSINRNTQVSTQGHIICINFRSTRKRNYKTDQRFDCWTTHSIHLWLLVFKTTICFQNDGQRVSIQIARCNDELPLLSTQHQPTTRYLAPQYPLVLCSVSDYNFITLLKLPKYNNC